MVKILPICFLWIMQILFVCILLNLFLVYFSMIRFIFLSFVASYLIERSHKNPDCFICKIGLIIDKNAWCLGFLSRCI